MTATQPRPSGADANARGLAVLAVAVVIGFLLLLNVGVPGSADDSSGPSGTVDASGLDPDETDDPGTDDPATTDPVDDPDATTTSSTPDDAGPRQPSEVAVLVLNSGGPTGSAGGTSTTLSNAGYNMGAADNAATRGAAETVVYFQEGFQVEADAVASVLGLGEDAVGAIPETAPGPGADTADVVVVLGADWQAN